MHKTRRLTRLVAIAAFALITIGLIGSVSAQQEEHVHTVRPGDTLQSIADFYDSSVEAIAARNGIIDASRIRVGQELFIPASGTNVNVTISTYTVQPGDRLSDIAIRFNTTEDELMQRNGITNPNLLIVGEVLEIPELEGVIAPGEPEVVNPDTGSPTPVTPAPVYVTNNGYYQIRIGDTLASIARGFGVDMYDIARANGILNLNHIYAGSNLFIPGR